MIKRYLDKKSKLIVNSVLLFIIFLFVTLSFASGCSTIKESVKSSHYNTTSPYYVIKYHNFNSDRTFTYDEALEEFDKEILDASTFVYHISRPTNYQSPVNVSNSNWKDKNKIYDIFYPSLISSTSSFVSSHDLLFGRMPIDVNEVLITKYTFETMCEYGYVNKKTNSTISGNELKKDPTKILDCPYSYSSIIGEELIICGVLDTPYNDEYKEILLENIEANWNNPQTDYYISQIYNEFRFEVDAFNSSLIVTDQYLELEQRSNSWEINGKYIKDCKCMLVDARKISNKKEFINKYSDNQTFYLDDRFRSDYSLFYSERATILSLYYIGFASLVLFILILSNMRSIIYSVKKCIKKKHGLVVEDVTTITSKKTLRRNVLIDAMAFLVLLIIGFIHNYFIISPFVGPLTIRVNVSYIFYIGEILIFGVYMVFKYLIYPKIRKYIIETEPLEKIGE